MNRSVIPAGSGADGRAAASAGSVHALCAPLVVDPGLLDRYGSTGPRYTSYPTALQFHDGFTEAEYVQCVQATNGWPIPAPLSLYVHLPFCERPCWYCGCTRIITRNRELARAYLRRLHMEIGQQGALFDPDRKVEQLHWGGGTPTFLSLGEMQELMEVIRQHFTLAPDDTGEFCIEVDPRTVDAGTIRELRGIGFNRLSLGVQDFDPVVQEAVNRIQPEAQVLGLLDAARTSGFRSVSVDLIYGLPRQNTSGFARTLERIVSAAPDRLCVYNYAHLPRQFKAQRMIREEDLPSPAEKLRMLQLTVEQLTASGYRWIGMDHFARPEDDLAQAQLNGTLSRNFQGYSTHGDCDIVGLGLSSISSVGDCYSQAVRDLRSYVDLVDGGRLPVARGLRLTDDDMVRRKIISGLMCDFRIDLRWFEERYQVGFWEHFSREREQLDVMAGDGLVELDESMIRVSAHGALLVRNICMVFDRYLRDAPPGARYSRLI